MKAATFEYHAPATIGDAVGLLAELGEGAKVIAGGQSLVPMLALRLAVLPHLVDLRKVDGIRGIEVGPTHVRIGAGVTQATIEASTELAAAVPLLVRATAHIGHFQIRNRGTIGGSLAHADAAAEYPAVALTLDAELEARSPRGVRTIPAGEFFVGTWTTALADDELLTAVVLPRRTGRCGHAIEELARRHGDFALAGATVAVQLDDAGTITRAAIGLFGLGPTPVRADAAEAHAIGRSATAVDAAVLGEAAVAELASVPTDLHGSASYRRRVGAVMVERAWQRAVQEASA